VPTGFNATSNNNDTGTFYGGARDAKGRTYAFSGGERGPHAADGSGRTERGNAPRRVLSDNFLTFYFFHFYLFLLFFIFF